MNRSLVSMVMAPRHVSSSSACLVQNQNRKNATDKLNQQWSKLIAPQISVIVLASNANLHLGVLHDC